jgi:hypothetical protein
MVSPPLVLARVSQTIDSLGFHLFPFAYLKSGMPSPESRQCGYNFPAGAECLVNKWCHLIYLS